MSVRTVLAAAVLAVMQFGTSCNAETIRVAAQKTGTFAWELAVIRSHGLDKKANLSIDVVELASPEAGKIALRSGTADVMVSDWPGCRASARSVPSCSSIRIRARWAR